MKKIISLILATVVLLSLTACGGKEKPSTEPPSNQSETQPHKIEETTEKKEPKYSDKYLHPTAINEMIKDGAYNEDEVKESSEMLKKVNGRIVDIQTSGTENYILTGSGLYVIDGNMFWCKELDIDVSGYSKIVSVCNDSIVLADKDGNITLFAKRNKELFEEKFVKWDIEEFKEDDKSFYIGEKSSYIWDHHYIITNINKDGMTAKVFSYDKIYEEGSNVKYLKTIEVPFKTPLNSEVKEFLFTKENNVTECFVHLENGELLYIMPLFNSVDGETQTHVIQTILTVDTKAEKVWNTRNYNVVLAKRTGDNDNLYKHRAVFTTDGYKHEEAKIILPDSFKADDIKEIIVFPVTETYCYILNNNDVFTCRYDEWQKIETVSNILKENKTVFITQINGYYCFLFDDGYLYAHLTDETANRFAN